MYLFKKFLGKEFSRFNSIVSDYAFVHNTTINMTACVSMPFKEILKIQELPLWTLPTEGVVMKRYFPAIESIDAIELYGEELGLKLFSLNHADYGINLQPNSGTQANQIVYNAILKDKDTVLVLDPKDGGHISHSKMGCRNINIQHYHVNNANIIDLSEIETKIKKYKPTLIIVGASSYSREIDYKQIFKIARQNNTLIMADICHSVLYIMGKIHKSIFPYVDFATFTMDKTLRGPQGGIVIYKQKYKQLIETSIFPKTQGGPIQNMLFAKCMCFLKCYNSNMKEYAHTVVSNARLFSLELEKYGLQIITSGTDTHMLLIDLEKLNITGKNAEECLYQNKIIVNRNQLPRDRRDPLEASGIRIGLIPVTNLEYTPEDLKLLARGFSNVLLKNTDKENIISDLINKYKTLNISN